jgi:chromosome segregation ATPase
MKTILMAGMVGIVLFAISASASWYLLNQKPVPPTVVEENGPAEDAGLTPMGKGINKAEQLPVALRPNVPLSVEAVLELSESIRKKEQQLLAREKAVEKTEQNIRLLFEDLKVERAELNALMSEMETKLKTAQNSVAELKQENQTLATKSQELNKLNQQLDKKKKEGGEPLDEIGQRVQTAKAWFEGLDDEQAANYLKEFANNGDLQFAVRLLKSMQQRKASKILAALNDPEFVQQILNSLTKEDKKEDPESDDFASRKRESLR